MKTRKLVSLDWAIKKLLRSKTNFGILEGFLSELLYEDIKIEEVLESESNQDTVNNKFNRVDIQVKNSKQEIIIIELQFDSEFDYFQRILFGTSKVITERIKSGQEFENVAKVISVNIIYFDLGQGDDYIYHGKTSFIGIHNKHELKLSSKQQSLFKKEFPHQLYPEYYILKVNEFDDNAKNTLDEWIYFLKNEEVKDNFKAKGLKEASETLAILNLSETERKIYNKYEYDRHYAASMAKNYKVDLKWERDKGIEQGKKEQSIEIALCLLKSNIEISIIEQSTGLTQEEIKKLSVNQNL